MLLSVGCPKSAFGEAKPCSWDRLEAFYLHQAALARRAGELLATERSDEDIEYEIVKAEVMAGISMACILMREVSLGRGYDICERPTDRTSNTD